MALPDEHLAFVGSQRSVSFLQTPAWGRIKTDWEHESLGWYAVDAPHTLVGAGLVLYRPLPRLRRYLAYLPEGPSCDWSARLGGGEVRGVARSPCASDPPWW